MKTLKKILLFVLLSISVCAFAQVRVTNYPTAEYHARWHPLHKDTLLFALNDGENIGLYKKSFFSSEKFKIDVPINGDQHYDITPDGKLLLVDGYPGSEPPYSIYSYNLETKEFKEIVKNAANPAFSPDGKRFSYKTFDGRMYTADLDGGNRKLLCQDITDYEISDWSPDGKKIALTSEKNGNADIWTVNVDGTNLKPITDSPNRDFWPCWSPNGKWLVYVMESNGGADLYLIDSSGNNNRQFTFHSSWDTQPEWSADGQEIIFSSQRYGNYDIFKKSVVVGIKDNAALEGSLELLSNPVAQTLRFSLSKVNFEGISAEVYDLAGKCLYRKYFKSSMENYSIFLGKGFNSGVYILKVNTGNNSFSKQFLLTN